MQQEGELMVVLRNQMGPQQKKIPKKLSKKDSVSGQENLVSPISSKIKGPMVQIGGFGVHPDSGKRG